MGYLSPLRCPLGEEVEGFEQNASVARMRVHGLRRDIDFDVDRTAQHVVGTAVWGTGRVDSVQRYIFTTLVVVYTIRV